MGRRTPAQRPRRSLVTVLDGEDGPRYRMLESVAAYSLERLQEAGESRLARRRHRVHYTELAERSEPTKRWAPPPPCGSPG